MSETATTEPIPVVTRAGMPRKAKRTPRRVSMSVTAFVAVLFGTSVFGGLATIVLIGSLVRLLS